MKSYFYKSNGKTIKMQQKNFKYYKKQNNIKPHSPIKYSINTDSIFPNQIMFNSCLTAFTKSIHLK